MEEAARSGGIARNTFNYWMLLGKNPKSFFSGFREDVLRARAETKADLIAKIRGLAGRKKSDSAEIDARGFRADRQ